MGARYYEPHGGSFLSADPLGHDASLSLYDYCGLDPDGRCKQGLNDGAAGNYNPSSANNQAVYNLAWGLSTTDTYLYSTFMAPQVQTLSGVAELVDWGLSSSESAARIPRGSLTAATFMFGPEVGGAIAGLRSWGSSMQAGTGLEAVTSAVVGAEEASFTRQNISPIIKETLSDNDFVRFDPTYLDEVIETGGIQTQFFDQEKIWLTKYGDIKNVTTAAELEQILYRKSLWPKVEGKFSNGATLRLINKIEDVIPAGITNKTNGVRQWRITHDIPASNLDLIFRLPQ